MDLVFLIPGDAKSRAEEALRKDDVVSRQSISVKQSSALGFKEDGFFIVISGSGEAVRKAAELLAPFGKPFEQKDAVLAKIKEDEDKAIEGFGNILG